ncbi:breast carcinoma-amplified sequence 4 [Marmota marmota marmota]|uniref:breast carcinoma-amplified sequence 4 n=1 Tax=Marmota marmota marmota TaxID=9994 RepID=UPI0020921B16|nr:breast carcinoma-amplified sequence 4 [Marmota marmota marmota]
MSRGGAAVSRLGMFVTVVAIAQVFAEQVQLQTPCQALGGEHQACPQGPQGLVARVMPLTHVARGSAPSLEAGDPRPPSGLEVQCGLAVVVWLLAVCVSVSTWSPNLRGLSPGPLQQIAWTDSQHWLPGGRIKLKAEAQAEAQASQSVTVLKLDSPLLWLREVIPNLPCARGPWFAHEDVQPGLTALGLIFGSVNNPWIRSDTSQILEENVPVLKAKVTEMRGLYAKVDRLEAFVRMVGHHAALLEAHVRQAERDHGAFPQALRRWLGSAGFPSFRNAPPAPGPLASELPTLYRTEDFVPLDAREGERQSR